MSMKNRCNSSRIWILQYCNKWHMLNYFPFVFVRVRDAQTNIPTRRVDASYFITFFFEFQNNSAHIFYFYLYLTTKKMTLARPVEQCKTHSYRVESFLILFTAWWFELKERKKKGIEKREKSRRSRSHSGTGLAEEEEEERTSHSRVRGIRSCVSDQLFDTMEDVQSSSLIFFFFYYIIYIFFPFSCGVRREPRTLQPIAVRVVAVWLLLSTRRRGVDFVYRRAARCCSYVQ